MKYVFVWAAAMVGGICGCEKPNQTLTFVLTADVQYAEKPAAGQRHYALSLSRLEAFVEAVNAQTPRPEFAIQLGDLIDGGEHAGEELKTVAAIYEQLVIPGYHVLGNHDFEGIGRDETLAALGVDSAYYAFERKGWRFVVLDTQDVAVQGGWAEDSAAYESAQVMLAQLRDRGAANAQAYNGAIGPEQTAWLEGVLAEADRVQTPVIVFGHLPLLPGGEKHTLWNAEQITAIFERRPCVKAYLCGHIHRGSVIRQNGIFYVTFEAMVDRADQTAVWYEIRLTDSVMEIISPGAKQHWSLSILK